MENRERNIALDIYRLVCMFLITTIHIIGYSDIMEVVPRSHFNFYMINGMQTLQMISISGFTLISAYFLIDAQNTAKKIVAFWFQLVFLSVSIFLISFLWTPGLSVSLLIKSVFPVFSNHYWYPVNYIFLLLLTPFLNKAIRGFSKKELQKVILLFAIAASVFFHLNPTFDPEPFVGHYSHSLLWFVFLYLIAAYLKIYGVKRPILYGPVMFFVSGMLLFLLFLLQNHGFGDLVGRMPILQVVLDRVNLLTNNSFVSLLFTVSSFVACLSMKIPSKAWLVKFFMFMSPSLFGIYLIQEHNAVRLALWKLVDITRWADQGWLIVVVFAVFIALWIGAVLLHQLYRLAHKIFLQRIEKTVLRLAERVPTASAEETAD